MVLCASLKLSKCLPTPCPINPSSLSLMPMTASMFSATWYSLCHQWGMLWTRTQEFVCICNTLMVSASCQCWPDMILFLWTLILSYSNRVVYKVHLSHHHYITPGWLWSAGLHIAEVCTIFRLPSHLSNYPHPLAYIHWFKPLQSYDNNVKMFRVSCSTRHHHPNAEVIPVHQIVQHYHLIPRFPQGAVHP